MRPAKRMVLLALTGGAAILGATPVSAAAVLGSTACALNNVTPSATACSGWYEGNLNSGNATDIANEQLVVNSLLGTTGVNYTFTDLGLSGSTISGLPALGTHILALHVGAAVGAPGGIGYDGTGFFKMLNSGSTVTVNVPGLSNARIFSVAAVPEIETWAMMLLGLGGVAYMMRRGRAVRRSTATVTYKGMARLA